MARVRTLSKGNQTLKLHRTDVDCYFQVLHDDQGRPILHLSTFGSDSRASDPKSSQSLQIDEAMAAELVELLRDTFRA